MRKVLLASTIALLGFTGTARAHFVLMTPASWDKLDVTGSPQKSFPCGETDSATVPLQAVATNNVTAYKPGDTVTVTVQETVNHPGWYRAVLATGDKSTLPKDPMVTAGATPCGTVNATANTIVGLTPQNPPIFPTLADGELFHTKPLGGVKTFSFKLPTDVTCDKCTLQIVEFMSDHGLNNPGGCFYHHCADISIKGATTTSTDGGMSIDASGEGGHDATGASGSGGNSTGVAGNGGVAGINGTGGNGSTGSAGTPGTAGNTGSGGTSAAAGTTGTGGSPNVAGGAGTSGTAGSTAPHQSGGGCSLASTSTRTSGLALLALAIGLAWRRSRRRF